MTHRVTVRMALLALLVLTTPGAGQDMPESSPEALMHYARGVERYVQGANEEAAAHLLQAFEADPSFYVALLMAGVAYGNLGRGDRADSLYALVAPHRHRLSPYYRARLDAQLASRRATSPGPRT